MLANAAAGEETRVSDEPRDTESETKSETAAELEAVTQRLREIQNRKRGRIRWNVSKHTAEMAIGALTPPPEKPPRRSGKQRRRKRKKRLL
jgi:hypothetical protein